MSLPASPSGPRFVAITGASGLIGSRLSTELRGRGDRVLHLVRRDPAGPDTLPDGVQEARWSPGDRLDPGTLEGVDGVVHLAGAGIGDQRWTAERKRVLVSSRVDGTATLARALAELTETDGTRPRLVSGSAVGYYGDRGDEVLTEDSSSGAGFLAQLCRDWEAATAPAQEAGLPVAHARTGIVLSPDGGALGRLLPLARLGLAGPLAGGGSWWPWITLPDQVRALVHLLDRPDVTGPVNLGAPAPATQQQVTRAIAHELHRPAVVPAPGWALRLVLGEMSSEILASTRAVPGVLQESGFVFTHPDVEQAARWVVHPPRG